MNESILFEYRFIACYSDCMNKFEKFLSGGDLRSIGASNKIVKEIDTQEEFDQLFRFLFHADRLVVMRAADAIEKISHRHPEYLQKHNKELFDIAGRNTEKELKWHLAQILPRLRHSKTSFDKSWKLLLLWAKDTSNSRIVRVNSIQSMYELTLIENKFSKELLELFSDLSREEVPSINARIRKIQKQMINSKSTDSK